MKQIEVRLSDTYIKFADQHLANAPSNLIEKQSICPNLVGSKVATGVLLLATLLLMH